MLAFDAFTTPRHSYLDLAVLVIMGAALPFDMVRARRHRTAFSQATGTGRLSVTVVFDLGVGSTSWRMGNRIALTCV